MSFAIIFNTLSGHRSVKRNRLLLNQLQQTLVDSVQEYYADSLQALELIVDTVLESKAHSLIIAGGDGTLNRVVNTLLRSQHYRDIKLAVLPNGTGNSFALDLGIVDMSTALEAINQGRLASTRLGVLSNSTEQRYFINNFGIGLVYQITSLASKMRFLGGFSYVVATLIHLIRLKPIQLQLTAGEVSYTLPVIFADVCKSKYTGGDMLMAPSVSINKGEFQVILLKSVSRLKLLKAFPKLFRGEHLAYDFVVNFKASDIHIESQPKSHSLVDGDLGFPGAFTIAIAPQVLNFYSLK
jgi:YegS/Rv2252/BmrU family lipid kinase